MSKIKSVDTKEHAIVIGGSIAGLLAARVLINHFKRVTLIERDHYPQDPTFRPGVPQSRQIHTTLLRGQRVLESLFPGLEKKLLAQGAIARDYGNQSLYFYGGRRCSRIPPVLHGWNSSRMLLEWQIRQELSSYSQLRIVEGHEVVHLLFDQSIQAVTGVQFRVRNHDKPEGNAIQNLQADLVIDASGTSSSRATYWLKELGYEAPEETVVTTSIGYSTRFYEPPANFQADWRGILIQPTPPSTRNAVLMEIEQGRWMVGLGGLHGDHPPTKEQEFLEFMRSLPEQALYEAVKEAKPISPIYGYRRLENRLRHFERLKRFPEQFIVIGDAACAFNPVYGQGMTVATLEAQSLDSYLRKQKKWQGFSLRFQKEIARIVARPWQLAAGADAQTTKITFRKWYQERVLSLLSQDPKVLLTFLEVAHMLRSPVALMHPKILIKVIASRPSSSKQ